MTSPAKHTEHNSNLRGEKEWCTIVIINAERT